MQVYYFALCSGCFIAASAYENKLALFSVSTSCGNDIIDKVKFLTVRYFLCAFYLPELDITIGVADILLLNGIRKSVVLLTITRTLKL